MGSRLILYLNKEKFVCGTIEEARFHNSAWYFVLLSIGGSFDVYFDLFIICEFLLLLEIYIILNEATYKR